MSTLTSRLILGLALTASLAVILPAFAETVSYKADLNAASQVPPNDSKGAGTVTATYDTAEAGKNAGVAVPIANPVSPFEGSADLTDAQAADLMAGKWYVNVHTANNKGGEIRGQVVKGK